MRIFVLTANYELLVSRKSHALTGPPCQPYTVMQIEAKRLRQCIASEVYFVFLTVSKLAFNSKVAKKGGLDILVRLRERLQKII
jgi:hypothetical protein